MLKTEIMRVFLANAVMSGTMTVQAAGRVGSFIDELEGEINDLEGKVKYYKDGLQYHKNNAYRMAAALKKIQEFDFYQSHFMTVRHGHDAVREIASKGLEREAK